MNVFTVARYDSRWAASFEAIFVEICCLTVIESNASFEDIIFEHVKHMGMAGQNPCLWQFQVKEFPGRC
jgi:hypothetical protein